MEQLKQEQSLLIHSACHDPLTNLPNRVLLCDRIGQVMSHALCAPKPNLAGNPVLHLPS
jgi:GGDEF domain-containing protein